MEDLIDCPKEYPDHVLNGVQESLKQAIEDKLTPYTGIMNMLLDLSE